MERLQFRSTTTIGLMAEMHQRDLLDEARGHGEQRRAPARPRGRPFGLRIFGPRSRDR